MGILGIRIYDQTSRLFPRLCGVRVSGTILELKSVATMLGPSEEQQIRTTLKKLGVHHGLLVNFQQPKKEGRAKIEFREVSI